MKEHEPTLGLTASKSALQYLNARRGGPTAYQGGPGHQVSSQPRPAARASQHPPVESRSAPPGQELICFYCQQEGHNASLCPIRKAKLSGTCYTPRAEVASDGGGQQRFKDVTINGESVTALVDSGSFLTLVQRELVPTGVVDYSRQEDSLCVYEDRHSYPTAEMTVVVVEQPYLLTVGVVERLPVAILGWDIPLLLDMPLEAGPKDSDLGKGLSGDHPRPGLIQNPGQQFA